MGTEMPPSQQTGYVSSQGSRLSVRLTDLARGERVGGSLRGLLANLCTSECQSLANTKCPKIGGPKGSQPHGHSH